MYITTKLKVFIGLCIIYSTLAGLALTKIWPEPGRTGYQIGPGQEDMIVLVAYVALVGLTGFLLARSDKNRAFRKSITFYYHLVGALAISAAAIFCWATLAYFGWRYAAWLLALSWGSYGLHWLLQRSQTKGISKKEAFR